MTRGETGWAYKNNEDGPWLYSPGEPEICWKKRQFNVDQFLTALDDRSDYLMPDNEDFRQGYSVGYAHAYGDLGDIKVKLSDRAAAAVMKFRARVNGRYYPGYHEEMRDFVRKAAAGEDNVRER